METEYNKLMKQYTKLLKNRVVQDELDGFYQPMEMKQGRPKTVADMSLAQMMKGNPKFSKVGGSLTNEEVRKVLNKTMPKSKIKGGSQASITYKKQIPKIGGGGMEMEEVLMKKKPVDGAEHVEIKEEVKGSGFFDTLSSTFSSINDRERKQFGAGKKMPKKKMPAKMEARAKKVKEVMAKYGLSMVEASKKIKTDGIKY